MSMLPPEMTYARNIRHQSGAALLMMMLIVILAAVTFLIKDFNRNTAMLRQQAATERSFAEAKKALVGYAVASALNAPGAPMLLPCPDIDDTGPTIEGEAHALNCGVSGVTVLGRIPWRTLNIAPPRDSSNECLWYAVSGDYKDAQAAPAEMVNPDSNGQIQVLLQDTGQIIEGVAPSERPVAILFAPEAPLASQSRVAVAQAGQQCADSFVRSDYLDTDSISTVSNAVTVDIVGIDQFIRGLSESEELNDKIVTISRAELAESYYQRRDFETIVRDVTAAAAACVAAYGSSNPGGSNDNRLPWPSLVGLADYRVSAQYDDTNTGVLSGRLADAVGDSNLQTSNGLARILTDCDPMAAPGWNAAMLGFWQQWKDHFFYYVADAYRPDATVPSSCGDCLTVNGTGGYAAVVLFANSRLSALSQDRDAPPIDTDTKQNIANYLEATTSGSHPYVGGVADLTSSPVSAVFNDILYCVDPAMSVSGC